MRRWILLLFLIWVPLSQAGDLWSVGEIPAWLSGLPDSRRQPQRQALYDWIISHAEAQTKIAIEPETLAGKRLINTANKLADDWAQYGRDEYRATLRYLILETDPPRHFTLEISAQELQRLLGRR